MARKRKGKFQRKIQISNLKIITDPIADEDNVDKITVNIEYVKLLDWKNETLFLELPTDHGVYVIYDFDGKPVYVGKTWREGGFKARFKEHRKHKHKYFPYWELVGKKIRLYCLRNKLEILTLEAIKIQQHEPPFNRVDMNVSAFEKERIKNLLLDAIDQITSTFSDGELGDSESTIRYIILKEGYFKVRQMLEKMHYNKNLFQEWYYENANDEKPFASKSKHYKDAVAELIFDN
ncbi:UNVERIFIED_CONTAM: hypothetical protein ABID98_001849 [Brevibacillus sp. OAP136]